MSSTATSTAPAQPQLGRATIGVFGLVFFVVAAAAPLAVMAGVAPIAIARGGIGAPGAYVVTGAVLGLFAVGYAAMSRHITNAGAFSAYVTHGLGKELGLGAALLATCCYSALAIALGALFAVFAHATAGDLARIDAPWQAWFFGALALAWLLGHRSIELSARVLGVALVLETAILLVVAIAVVVADGAAGLSAAPFAPSHIFAGDSAGMFAIAGSAFIGFEATAVFGEEARDPQRTVRRATFLAVALLAVTYAFLTWSGIMGLGLERARLAAQRDPIGFYFAIADSYVGAWAVDTMRVLVVTSALAAFLAFHNAASRYLFALARAGVLPAAVAVTHPRHRSPAAANLVQTLLAGAAMTAAIVASLRPYEDVFVLAGVTSVTAVFALEALTSLAVVGYFRRDRRGLGAWTTLAAPALAAAGLVAMLVVSVANIDVLTARPSLTGDVLLGAAGGLFLLGVAYAVVLRFRRRVIYEGLATVVVVEQ